MTNDIETPNGFRGKYAYLSNFYEKEFFFKEFQSTVATAEHAFQAMKTFDASQRQWVLESPTPLESKKRGRAVKLRKDWDTIYRKKAMLTIVRQKFQDPELREKLLQTKGILVEYNTWHDTYFGKCTCNRHNGEGKNVLGKILMYIRNEIRAGV